MPPRNPSHGQSRKNVESRDFLRERLPAVAHKNRHNITNNILLKKESRRAGAHGNNHKTDHLNPKHAQTLKKVVWGGYCEGCVRVVWFACVWLCGVFLLSGSFFFCVVYCSKKLSIGKNRFLIPSGFSRTCRNPERAGGGTRPLGDQRAGLRPPRCPRETAGAKRTVTEGEASHGRRWRVGGIYSARGCIRGGGARGVANACPGGVAQGGIRGGRDGARHMGRKATAPAAGGAGGYCEGREVGRVLRGCVVRVGVISVCVVVWRATLYTRIKGLCRVIIVNNGANSKHSLHPHKILLVLFMR